MVGKHRLTPYSTDCLLDAEGQNKLAAKAFLPKHWDIRWQAAETVHHRSASKHLIDVIGNIALYHRVGNSLAEDVLHIVKKLAVSILLKTSFNDEKTLGIWLKSKSVVPRKYKPVLIHAT